MLHSLKMEIWIQTTWWRNWAITRHLHQEALESLAVRMQEDKRKVMEARTHPWVWRTRCRFCPKGSCRSRITEGKRRMVQKCESQAKTHWKRRPTRRWTTAEQSKNSASRSTRSSHRPRSRHFYLSSISNTILSCTRVQDWRTHTLH